MSGASEEGEPVSPVIERAGAALAAALRLQRVQHRAVAVTPHLPNNSRLIRPHWPPLFPSRTYWPGHFTSAA